MANILLLGFIVLFLFQIGCSSPTADVATEPVIQAAPKPSPATHPMVSKIAAILQEGWDVKQDGDRILVARHEPVKTYGNVAMPPEAWSVMKEAKRDLKYQITIEIGELVSKSKFRKMLEVNSETKRELKLLAERMRDFRSKTDFRPRSDNERKLYEEYRNELRELPYHRVPDLYDDRNSYYVITPRHSRESFVYPREERECRAVLENIFTFADAYDDFNDKTEEDEFFDYPFNHKVETTFYSRRDYDDYLLRKRDILPELR